MSPNIKNSIYFEQVRLLLQVIPFISREECFALKGGTAINFFIRDLPRLSVDIDLNYLPIESRDITFKNIDMALKRIFDAIVASLPDITINKSIDPETDLCIKLFIKRKDFLIKVEPNQVFRGNIFLCSEYELVKPAVEAFELTVNANIMSIADIYGSKLCALLDRQHPRDIFDIGILLENEGITNDIRKAFIIYLISHRRPIHELLQPNILDIKQLFENEFKGMSIIDCSYEGLTQTRIKVVSKLKQELTNDERKFILSIKKGEPEWDLINLPGVDKLPSVKWKLQNISRMNDKKHKEYLEKLKKALEL